MTVTSVPTASSAPVGTAGGSVTGRPRGRPRSEEADRAILAAAVEEIVANGTANLSMEAVAARAGVAKSTVYRRWPGSAELCVDALRSVEDYEFTVLEADPRSVLVDLVDQLRRRWANPRFASLMRRVSADAASDPERFTWGRKRFSGAAMATFDRAIEDAVEAGLIRPDLDRNWVRGLLTAPVLAGTLLHTSVSRAQVEFVVDTVLAGVRP